MKITNVRFYDLQAHLQKPFEWPDGTAAIRNAGVVRIESDTGLVGWGPGRAVQK